MQQRVRPPKLIPGDKIAIVATARKISPDELQPAIQVFQSWGLEVVVDDELFAVDHQFAGGDEIRASLFQRYLVDTNIKAIISARGGYGTVRMIDKIDVSPLQSHPKWIIGYSDITVLHNHIHQHTNLMSLHATMPINMQAHNFNKESVHALRDVLMGEHFINYPIQPHVLNKPGLISGELVGGNLSVLYSLLASSSDIDTSGKVLFIEDLDEYLYHIDRMMQALKRAGKLAHLRGLIVGGMSDMKDNLVPFGQTPEEIILNCVNTYNYPVLFNFPAGHESVNYPLILGDQIIINI